MQEQSKIVSDLSKMTDADYLNESEVAAIEIPRNALRNRFRGLALGAPASVSIDSNDRLPALLVNGESAARSKQLPLTKNAIVVAVDVGSGSVSVGTAFPQDPSKSPGEPDEDSLAPKPVETPISPERAAKLEALGFGDKAGAVWLDMKRLLRIPWKPSRLALRVISYDEVSNPVFVQLASQHAEPVANFPLELAQEIGQRASRQEKGAGNLDFARSAKTPNPNGNGVALTLEANKLPVGTAHLFAYGAVRVELSAQMIVDRNKLSNPSDPEARAKLPAAVVRTMLLLTAVNQNQPARVPVDIPVWSTRDLRPGEVVDAAFSLDLVQALFPMELVAGTYSIYLIAGRHFYGPDSLRIDPKG